MKMDPEIAESMIAPCGITCYACYAHLRRKKPCIGCQAPNSEEKPAYCRSCAMKSCAHSQGLKFCFECPTFPCVRIKKLDKRYRLGYQINLIENGLRMKEIGLPQYLQEERLKWTCPACGGVISLHARTCSECGQAPQQG
jgi:hypothetical protein